MLDFNLALDAIAQQYHVPLINLWAAARVLPDYGLEADGIHMQHSGWETLYYATGHEAYYGMSLQNLLSLTILHEIQQAVMTE